MKNELRIGNLVWGFNDQNNPIVVEGIHEDGINPIPSDDGKPYGQHCGTIECDEWEHLEPIPLTEERLKILGWVWNDECDSFEKHPDGDARMHLQWNDVSKSYTMFNYVLKAMIAQRIQYVHQLQNLYYFLSGGKELEFEWKTH